MMKVMMKGNEVLAEAAIKAGCKYFFGYPITPQSELVAYMAKRLSEIEGGVFLQSESEVAAINMVYGAAAAGKRVMTSSSSPGFSLKQEGISFMAAAELPAVLINVMRGGPGLGNIQPGQSDYFQMTKGGGHGDYFLPVYAPSTLQEIIELMVLAFDVADYYRTPVIIALDGLIGQMMEPVSFEDYEQRELPEKTWAASGTRGDGDPKIINSLYLDQNVLENHNYTLYERQEQIRAKEARYESLEVEDAEIIIVAYGTMARIVRTAIKKGRQQGIKVGMIRPISLWPFPQVPFERVQPNLKKYLVIEMSTGQMIEDVRLAVNGKVDVDFFGRTGGVVPSVEEILEVLVGGVDNGGYGRSFHKN